MSVSHTLAVALVCSAVFANLLPAQTPSTGRREPRPQVRYPLGPDSRPRFDAPKGKLEGPFLFHSQILKDTVRQYWVFVPAQYDANKPANVLVFQDGARATNPQGVLQVPQVLENLIAKRQIPVTIGVFITPGQRGSEYPADVGTGNPDNRDREYDVLDDAYARFVIEEMLPEVGKKYNLTQDPAGRAIGGSSSGAICAFTVAWHRPDQFRNVVSMIGSYTNIHGGHVYPDLVRQAEKKPIRIFLQDGVNDLRSPQNLERDWYLQNQKMVAALAEKGYDMAHVFGEGGHSDDHGGAILPQMLRWIWRDAPGIEPPGADLVAEAAAVMPEVVELFPGFDPAAKVDPSGVYTWETRGGNRASVSKLTLKLADGKLSGSCETTRGDEPPVIAQIGSPTLEGNKLIFDLPSRFRDREILTTYQGIVGDEGLTGWRLSDFGGQPRDSSWTANRQK